MQSSGLGLALPHYPSVRKLKQAAGQVEDLVLGLDLNTVIFLLFFLSRDFGIFKSVFSMINRTLMNIVALDGLNSQPFFCGRLLSTELWIDYRFEWSFSFAV